MIINYFLLILACGTLRLKPRRLRLLLGAAIGAVGSFELLLPAPDTAWLAAVMSVLYKCLLCLIISAAVVGLRQKRVFVRFVCAFLLFSFAFAGVIFSLILVFEPSGVAATAGSVYFDISPLTLIIFTAVSYVILKLIERICSRVRPAKQTGQLTVGIGDTVISCRAALDTGSSLRDVYNGAPVVILTPELLHAPIEQLKGYRCIPFSSLGCESGILKAFRPDFVRLDMGGESIEYDNITVACAEHSLENGFGALLPTDMLTKM